MKKTAFIIVLSLFAVAAFCQKDSTAKKQPPIDSTQIAVFSQKDYQEFVEYVFGYSVQDRQGQVQFIKGTFFDYLSNNPKLSNAQYEEIAGAIYRLVLPWLEARINRKMEALKNKDKTKPEK